MKFRYKLILSLLATLVILGLEHGFKSTRHLQSPPEEIGTATAYLIPNGGDKISGEVEYLQIYGDMKDGLILSPSFTVAGKELREPDFVKFYLVSYFMKSEFRSMSKLSIIADDKLIFDGRLKMISPPGAVIEPNVHYEGGEVNIPYMTFKNICDSDTVQLSTGGATVLIPDLEMQKLRDMCELVKRGGRFD